MVHSLSICSKVTIWLSQRNSAKSEADICTVNGASTKVDHCSRTGSRNITAAGFTTFFLGLAGKQYPSCCKPHDKDFKIWGQEIWPQLMNCFKVARCDWSVEQALLRLRVVYMTCTPSTGFAGD